MKFRNVIYLFGALALLSCTNDDFRLQGEEQTSLTGRRVRFSASVADQFMTRATQHHDGSFNEGDQMRIFRQYAIGSGGSVFDGESESFRTYYFKMDYATGTTVSLHSDWFPMDGKLKSDDPLSAPTVQTEADSLVWENGRTVRFRAWGRSNLDDAINIGTRESYYPDYTVSDWVTVSGPTYDIPLSMHHIACRIGLTCKPGNEFAGAVICTDWHDYKRDDNDDTQAHDDLENAKTDEQAQEECNQVLAAYNRMCMPGGIDDRTFLPVAMTQALYNDDNTDFRNLEQYGTADGIVKIGTLSAAEIESQVQHPVFNSNDGRLYMMSIPYDMSSGALGQELTLPACTRFKVWLYDVNNGDKAATEGTEGSWHIFALSDIKTPQGAVAFPNGLPMKAGYSYLFSVGYHYDHITITATDSFSWTEQDLGTDNADDEAQSMVDLDFTWWTQAYRAAAKIAVAGGDFNPAFSVSNQREFITFIRLVNGTAASKMSGLTRGEVRKDNEGHEIKDEDGFETYWWIYDDGSGNPVEITREDAEALGYVFYPHFYPTVSTQAAHVREDYITGPIDFFDPDYGSHFDVSLTQDLDLYDWELPSIGHGNTVFSGNFKGNGHKLTNVNMQNGYLFEHVMDCAISNLRIESVHNLSLVRKAVPDGPTGWGCYISGISLMCNSTACSIADTLQGTSYVVGCIHVGNSTKPLVGVADDLTMLGCMQAASGIPSGTGALLGAYSEDAESAFFAPLRGHDIEWGVFMCNYYDTEKSPGTNAVGAVQDAYGPRQYIRGAASHVLKAKNDYLIGPDVDYYEMSANMRREIYGLAPWKAMNYAISQYNQTEVGTKYPCQMHYTASTVGYVHLYPELVTGALDADESWNPLIQNN